MGNFLAVLGFIGGCLMGAGFLLCGGLIGAVALGYGLLRIRFLELP